MKRWLGWALIAGIIVASMAGGALLGNLGETKLAATPAPQDTDGKEEEQEKIEQALLTTGPVKAEALKLSLKDTSMGWNVGMVAELDDGKLTTVLDNARGLLRTLSSIKVKVSEVNLIFRTSKLRDVYGKAIKDLQLAQIKIGAQTWEKADWNGFDPRNFAAIVDEYKLHPLVAKQPLPPPKPNNASMLGEQEQKKSAATKS